MAAWTDTLSRLKHQPSVVAYSLAQRYSRGQSLTTCEQAIKRSTEEMRNQDWFCLALRLFGIWLLIQAVETFVSYVSFFFSSGNAFTRQIIVSTVAWSVGRTASGLVLLLFAPAIATRFYPSRVAAETTRPEVDGTKPLKVGIQLMAVYALLLAVQSGAGVILGLLNGGFGNGAMAMNFRGAGASYLASLLTVGLNLAFAAMLLIWNDRIITFIEKFRYVPERDAYEPPPISE